MDTASFGAILCAVLLSFYKGNAWTITEEENLITTLLNNYRSDVRPAEEVEVNLNLVPLSLNNLSWFDPRLVWNPAVHGNITDLVIYPERLWTPPIVVENAVTDVGLIGGEKKDRTPLRLVDHGVVVWYPPLETSTSCEMKIAQYPFDSQTCTIVLTAWGFSASQLHLDPGDIVFTYYSPNGEWDLRSWSISNGSFSDGINVFPRTFVQFNFRRKWQFYGQNLLLPIVLTSLLMCFVFVVPLESGEKIGYALTVLLSYVVFLTWVTDNLPPISNDVSVLQVYLAIVLCLGVTATLMTCWVLSLYHTHPSKPMSSAMRLVVSRVLVPLRDCTCRSKGKRNNKVQEIGTGTPVFTPSKTPVMGLPTKFSEKSGKEKLPETFSSKLPEEEVTPEPDYSWQEVAAMFDGLFFILYLLLMPIVTIVILVLLYENY